MFDRIRLNRQFARGLQWVGMKEDDLKNPDRPYVANYTARHLKQSTAALYARNPTFVFRRSKRLYSQVWDGTAETLTAAMTEIMTAQGAGQEAGEMSMTIAQEAAQQAEITRMLDRYGETLTILYSYYLREQQPSFKTAMKRLVLRSKTCGVGWVKQGWRKAETRDTGKESLLDDRAQLEAIGQITEDLVKGDLQADSAAAERLRLINAAVSQKEQVMIREGLTLSYPDPTMMIPSREMSSFAEMVTAPALTEKALITKERVKQVYGVDVGDKARPYKPIGAAVAEEDKVCVYTRYDKRDGLVYVVCDGYDDFLRPPAPPEPWSERFYPYFCYAPNELDDPETPAPPSDVELIEPMQRQVNAEGDALREHRDAARPGHVANSALGEEGLKRLGGRRAHDVIQLPIDKDDDIRKHLQPIPVNPIDPNLYDTTPAFRDTLRVVGAQQAELGPTSSASATEASIAATSRQNVDDSATDELDEMLTEMARHGGQILCANLDVAVVKEIVGPGAVWLPHEREDLAKEVHLEVEAGSSGRKNAAAEIQARTQMFPLIAQVPGLSSERVGRDLLRTMDPNSRWEDWVQVGAPSIVAANGMMQASANAGGTSAPGAQGVEGASNAPTPETPGRLGPQPPVKA
ncbi:MAG: hypothetical protein KAX54_00275 [Thauera sp.]|nr:hypothetical protein [Thauera sp.]